MIQAIVIALVIFGVVWLVCVFLGRILKAATIPLFVTIGAFLEEFAIAIGILAALLFFFGGGDSFFGIKR